MLSMNKEEPSTITLDVFFFPFVSICRFQLWQVTRLSLNSQTNRPPGSLDHLMSQLHVAESTWGKKRHIQLQVESQCRYCTWSFVLSLDHNLGIVHLWAVSLLLYNYILPSVMAVCRIADQYSLQRASGGHSKFLFKAIPLKFSLGTACVPLHSTGRIWE